MRGVRGLKVVQPSIIALADYDQWSVPNVFDRHRPLFRVALGDAVGTDIYVSSVTGEVVLDTTRSERWWSFFGSVLHWIYPTLLRSNWVLWDKVVWTLSLLALIAACARGGAWGRANQDSGPARGVTLSWLACLAPLHRIDLDGLRPDLDFQRLAFHGPRTAVLTRAVDRDRG